MAPDAGEDLIRSALRRLLTAADRQAAAEASVLGLGLVDRLALTHVARVDGLTPAELARRMRLSPGGAAAAIDRLERHGLVARRPGPGGRRRVLLRTTPDADTVLDRLRTTLGSDVDALVRRLGPAERAAVESFVTELGDLFQRHADRVAQTADETAARASGAPIPVRWG